MSLAIEPATMFFALVASTIAAMLVLLWGYWLNRGERSLLWMALGFLLGATANFLFAGRPVLPPWLAITTGGSLLTLGVSFLHIAARTFNGKPLQIWTVLAGPAAWLALCAIPAFYANPDARVVAVSAIAAAYYLFAAREFAVRDGLVTRLPMALVLVAHGAFVLARIPFVLTDDEAGISVTRSGWFGAASLEALIFVQVAAFLMVSLTKERVTRRLREAAHTDPLTGLGNRRAFFQRGEAAVAQALRNGSDVAVAVFDLDRFKEINDRHGHPIGDAVIQAFAHAAGGRLRASDFVARLGGEEFAAILPDTDGERAVLVAMQVNQAFEATVAALPHPGLTGTVSAGVAHLADGRRSLEALLVAADRALYEAKALGRGQVRLAAAEADGEAMAVRAA
jgi:diguanylate cyclase (GGDEF)-like protein